MDDEEADGERAQADDAGAEYEGQIKSYSSRRGYGFIDCPELAQRFGRDVFIHQSQFEGLHVLDRVTFRIQMKNGQPQASDVTPVEGQRQMPPPQQQLQQQLLQLQQQQQTPQQQSQQQQ